MQFRLFETVDWHGESATIIGIEENQDFTLVIGAGYTEDELKTLHEMYNTDTLHESKFYDYIFAVDYDELVEQNDF